LAGGNARHLTARPMIRFFIRRTLFSVLVLLIVSATIFVLTHLVPGSPALIVLGPDATDAQIRQFEQDNGLDRPLVVQYLDWLQRAVFEFDLGRSFVSRLPISSEIAKTLPVTLEIVVFAFIFCILVSIPLGIVSALYEDRPVDHLARIFAVLGVSIPGFWLGLMLIAYGAVQLRWFPPGGFVPWSAGVFEHLRSLALPAFALGIYYTAIISRMTRSGMIEAMQQDYIRTARAMGLPRRRVLFYALKNALIPVISVCAMSFGFMFGWAIIIEQVFNIAGLSRLLLSAIFQRDYYVVQAVVLVLTSLVIAINLVADIVFGFLNPKIRGAS
jgi:peptide/nickel transport system permease protein